MKEFFSQWFFLILGIILGSTVFTIPLTLKGPIVVGAILTLFVIIYKIITVGTFKKPEFKTIVERNVIMFSVMLFISFVIVGIWFEYMNYLMVTVGLDMNTFLLIIILFLPLILAILAFSIAWDMLIRYLNNKS